ARELLVRQAAARAGRLRREAGQVPRLWGRGDGPRGGPDAPTGEETVSAPPPAASPGMVRFACTCGKQMQAKAEYAGRMTKCPGGGAAVEIPDPDAPARGSGKHRIQGERPSGARHERPSGARSARRDEDDYDDRDDREERAERRSRKARDDRVDEYEDRDSRD